MSTTELLIKIGQEWEAMKKDMSDLRKENQALSNKVSSMSKDHDEVVKGLKADTKSVRKQNKKLSDKVDALETDLNETKQNLIVSVDVDALKIELDETKQNAIVSVDALKTELDETKQKLESEVEKNNDFRRIVASLKQVWNRAFVSAHKTSPQTSAQPTPQISSGGKATSGKTVTFPTLPVRSSPPPVAKKPPTPPVRAKTTKITTATTKPVTTEARKYMKDTSRFDVGMSCHRPILAWEIVEVNNYDWVDVDSECMDNETGVYTTPLEGRYGFDIGVCVKGAGVDADVYLCGGDGRKEKAVGAGAGQYDVEWDCPEGLTVWVEVGAGTLYNETEFTARFYGGLIN